MQFVYFAVQANIILSFRGNGNILFNFKIYTVRFCIGDCLRILSTVSATGRGNRACMWSFTVHCLKPEIT